MDMLTYSGTKTLKARPMTRGEYNKFRVWDIPANENPNEAGYLVEYVDGGTPNHPDHAGYVSWSPADVFEATYRPSGTWQERLIVEYADLHARHVKLTNFINSETFLDMTEGDREGLEAQHGVMGAYAAVLAVRLSDAGIGGGGVTLSHA